MNKTWSLIIHGGAGELDHVRKHAETLPYLESIRIILEQGHKLLKRGGSALDAVELCASMLEDNPLFNAGHGAVLNEDGKTELDAAIMDGKNLNAGAVAGISCIANPVQLARLVLEESNHVMLIGNGAERFAKQHGIKPVTNQYFITDKRLDEFKKLHAARRISKTRKHGTIGAVAMDKKGNLAAATSTGGLVCKQQGRVGDSPIIGAGVYADNKTCTVSATGHGEMFMRTVLTKHIADLIQFRKLDADSAAKLGINYLKRRVDGHGGVIVIDRYGRCASRYNTRTMIRGWIERGKELHCMIK
jgi:beta-aspartyl-peptidase (threonine type)